MGGIWFNPWGIALDFLDAAWRWAVVAAAVVYVACQLY